MAIRILRTYPELNANARHSVAERKPFAAISSSVGRIATSLNRDRTLARPYPQKQLHFFATLETVLVSKALSGTQDWKRVEPQRFTSPCRSAHHSEDLLKCHVPSNTPCSSEEAACQAAPRHPARGRTRRRGPQPEAKCQVRVLHTATGRKTSSGGTRCAFVWHRLDGMTSLDLEDWMSAKLDGCDILAQNSS